MRQRRHPLPAHMQHRIQQRWRAASCCWPRLLPKTRVIRVRLTRCNKRKTGWDNQPKFLCRWRFKPSQLWNLPRFRHGAKPPMMVYSAGRWCRVWLRWWLSWGWLGVSWGESLSRMQLALCWRKHLHQPERQCGYPAAAHSQLRREALRQRCGCPLPRVRCCVILVWMPCCWPIGRRVVHPHCKYRPAFCAVPRLIQRSVEFWGVTCADKVLA